MSIVSLENFICTVMLSLAVSTISVTITKTIMFKPIRSYIEQRSKWFGELFHCPYCLSHWVALFLFVFYAPKVINGFMILDYLVTFFVIVALATFWSFVICSTLKVMDSLGSN